MAATPGNQWWKLRAKNGRDAIFTSPEQLWNACLEYFESVDGRTWDQEDWVGKDAEKVTRHHVTPYTLTGLCVFLDVGLSYLNQFEQSDTAKSNKDFSVIISRVRQIIATQQLEGSMTGFFNPTITARLNNLTEKTETALSGTVNLGVTVTKKEAKDISDALENDC